VDPDLVGAAGLQGGLGQLDGREGLQDPPLGDGGAAGRDHGHALAVAGVAADGGVDRALGGGEAALDQGQVLAVDPVGGQVAGQGQVGGVVLGHQ
jgi:hypothetical protein